MINRGVFEDNIEYFAEFIKYSKIVGNFQKIAQACGNNFLIERKIETKLMQSVVDKHHELVENNNHVYMDDELLEMFKDYGQTELIDNLMPF